ncbi:MAG: metallophosphoesterase family protein [Nitrospinaceae bacterium]
MRYIIFSDIHSNLESLQVFEQIVRTIRHDKKICLGDLVGYGADPNPCVEWIRENADFVIAGNHDYAVVGKTDLTYFNPYAYQACLWTRQELTRENKGFLASLPLEKEEDGVYWVHSSPREPHHWHYVITREDGEKNFDYFPTRCCFVGHSHRPLILEQGPEGEIDDYISPAWDLKNGCRYLFNVGSLGQPRDGNPDPSFVIFDSGADTIEFRRYRYDFTSTQQKIRDSGLPYPLADRLSYGL